MTRNHLCCSTPVFLMVRCLAQTLLLGPWVALTAPCQRGEGCACLNCPAGQEPSKACGEVGGAGVRAECRACPSGTFSDSYGPEPCRPHTDCKTLNRRPLVAATSSFNAACGVCLPGFHTETMQESSTLHACVRTPTGRRKRSVGGSTPHGSAVGVTNATNVYTAEEMYAEYAVYALVPVFCVMGLLGIFICNLLKKKGYTCSSEKEIAFDDTPQKDGEPCPYIVENTNEDTITALVRLIAEKTENAAALEEMLLEYELKQKEINMTPLPVTVQFQSKPRLRTNQHHLHTINGLLPHSGFCCSRCSQKKWPKLLLPPAPLFEMSHTPVKHPSPSEGTILSVGRFQVAQIQESKPVSKSVNPAECCHTAQSAEGVSFLGMTSLSKAPSPHAADRTTLFLFSHCSTSLDFPLSASLPLLTVGIPDDRLSGIRRVISSKTTSPF